MKPVAWIKIRELAYMKAVADCGKDDWQTNLGWSFTYGRLDYHLLKFARDIEAKLKEKNA